jgi:hypothetical protein
VKCSFSEGAKTSTLLPSGSWNTQTPSPLWLNRSPKTRPKKSAVASGFSVRVPTHPILRSSTVDRLPCPLDDVDFRWKASASVPDPIASGRTSGLHRYALRESLEGAHLATFIPGAAERPRTA